MKRYIMVAIGLALVLSVTVGRGEWKMRVHMGETVEEHTLVEIE